MLRIVFCLLVFILLHYNSDTSIVIVAVTVTVVVTVTGNVPS